MVRCLHGFFSWTVRQPDSQAQSNLLKHEFVGLDEERFVRARSNVFAHCPREQRNSQAEYLLSGQRLHRLIGDICSKTTVASRARRQSNIVLQTQLRLRIAVSRRKSHGQFVFDSKHAIVSQVLAAFVEDLCCQRAVALVANHEMDVCGAEWVPVHHLQELTSWTIVGNLRYISS